MSEGDSTSDEKAAIEKALAGPDWGFMVGSIFVRVPKRPLLNAGHYTVPVKVQVGVDERTIIERPAGT